MYLAVCKVFLFVCFGCISSWSLYELFGSVIYCHSLFLENTWPLFFQIFSLLSLFQFQVCSNV